MTSSATAPDRDHYAVLQVPHDASKGQLVTAYRRAMRSAHPDRGGCDTEAVSVTQAYAVLSNPSRRRDYDDELSHRLRHPGDGLDEDVVEVSAPQWTDTWGASVPTGTPSRRRGQPRPSAHEVAGAVADAIRRRVMAFFSWVWALVWLPNCPGWVAMVARILSVVTLAFCTLPVLAGIAASLIFPSLRSQLAANVLISVAIPLILLGIVWSRGLGRKIHVVYGCLVIASLAGVFLSAQWWLPAFLLVIVVATEFRCRAIRSAQHRSGFVDPL